jgi:hypothetical protein
VLTPPASSSWSEARARRLDRPRCPARSKAWLTSPFVSQKMVFMLAQLNKDDLELLRT